MIEAVDFVRKWKNARGTERSNYQIFLLELAHLIGATQPEARAGEDTAYGFEKQLRHITDVGTETTNFIDLYKAGCFVLEAKMYADGSPRRGTPGWTTAMQKAYGQARRYASSLPGRKVPFLITVDVGHVIEIWSDFSGDGNWPGYAAGERILIESLLDEKARSRLRAIFEDPESLDPLRHAAKVTRDVASKLAGLSKSLEGRGHEPSDVAHFLMRCLFTMFAEDVGLLDQSLFTRRIENEWMPHPETFPSGLSMLWRAMDTGASHWGKNLPRFNGRLFRMAQVIPLDREQLGLLHEASRCDWSDVEPAIFGTLLERALNPVERERLGAHFTPRAYIERLVRPALMEPLREEWSVVQAELHGILGDAPPDQEELPKEVSARAQALLEAFHSDLCKTLVLDPACGTGNFLYVSFHLLKDLETEVLRMVESVAGAAQLKAEVARASVNPSQFLGMETNPRAVEIAELVLWIGYLQWWRRQNGDAPPPEPILRAYDNIRRQDAVLEWDGDPKAVKDEHGDPITTWDMRSWRTDPVTRQEVPDEAKRVQRWEYPNARQAGWPKANYIVGNPPFIGSQMMRMALGDGYTEALRRAWPTVPGSADLVMYWWERAATLVRAREVRRFGFITTNSITQPNNRAVVQAHLAAKEPVAIAWCVPDHPWVDSHDGAAVRIAMTVGARPSDVRASVHASVVREQAGGEDDTAVVTLNARVVTRIHADLSAGADVAGAKRLRANQGVSFQGVNLVGQGFRLTPEEVKELGYPLDSLPPVLRPYKNARDLTQGGPPRYVIDFFGFTADEARDRYPALYQRLLLTVKPERDQNNRVSRRTNWWLFGETVGRLRTAVSPLQRAILTPRTSRHRVFVFASSNLLPDCKNYSIAMSSGCWLAILAGRCHRTWAEASGSHLGVGNDLTYNNGDCFEKFPFPDLTAAQRARLDDLGERLDAHQKIIEASVPRGTLTAQYNALARLREARGGGAALTDAERQLQERLLTALLAEIHDEVDAAVAEAYDWPVDLPVADILERLVRLNAERAAEEAGGLIRWLRPDLQAGAARPVQPELELPDADTDPEASGLPRWPRNEQTKDQIRAVLAAVRSAAKPWSAEQVASRFANARRERVREHLDALEHYGVLDAEGEGAARVWWAPRS